jgi:tRNA nucleotidyltransferase (CCA-adding enzyme)
MQKLNDIRAIHKEILKKITPTPLDRAKIKALAETLQRKVEVACRENGITAEVRIEGSVAKDTWLREEPEIDVFMRLSPTIPRRSFGEISLKIARKATENASKQVERFAEHPYLEAFIDDVRLNIVPCYDVKPGEWLSATDRTPFHTDYVKKRLDERLRGEVRVLKKFLKGVGVYGAEIKTGGFSGYLCELLLVHYKSFTATLQAFAGYTQRIAIDIECFYGGRERELNRLFPEPLVTVDPVDKTRNVASAVQPQKLYTLVAAARAFLKTPDKKFFYPPKITALTPKALGRELKNRGEALVFLPLENVETIPDVLWGQLYKTKRALRKLAMLNDFKVLRDAVWSDEKTFSVFTLEKECEKFLSKYTSNGGAVSGPLIEDGRWVVELRRRFTDVAELLKENLGGGGRNIGVAEVMSQAFKEKLEVLVDNDVLELYRINSGFAEFLTSFLSGKPFWLEIAEG